MTADDLKNYKAIERPVVRGTYRGYDIVSMPPPSSGGVHLIEMLNILEGYDLGKLPREASAARRNRSDEARLCRPRRLHGRSRLGQNADRRIDLEKICRHVARKHHRQIDAGGRHSRRQAGRDRRPEHDALFHYRQRRQCGLQHLHTQLLLRSRPDRRRHRRVAQQRARRFRRQGRRVECLWPHRLERQSARTEQASAVVDDADHRIERRQAVSDHRLARRQPHHHRGAADHRQCHRLQNVRLRKP